MHIAIAGASGFVGQKLVKFYLNQGAKVTVIGRDAKKLSNLFAGQVHQLTWDTEISVINGALHDCELIVNLAGENIASSRWHEKVKDEILESRLAVAKKLCDWYKVLKHKPNLFVASAVSAYGIYPENNKTFTEQDNQVDNSFLAHVACELEKAYGPLEIGNARLVLMRFAVVLDFSGGMLKRLVPQFKFGFGSVLGSGQQIFAWVGLEDLIKAIEFTRVHDSLKGTVNVVAPCLDNQKAFAKTFAAYFSRPCLLKTPAIALSLLLGKQMTNELLMQGTHAIPKKLIDAGFKFVSPDLNSFFKNVTGV